MPVRELDCLRLGTAIITPYRKCLILKALENPSGYAVISGNVKCEVQPARVGIVAVRVEVADPNCRPMGSIRETFSRSPER